MGKWNSLNGLPPFLYFYFKSKDSLHKRHLAYFPKTYKFAPNFKLDNPNYAVCLCLWYFSSKNPSFFYLFRLVPVTRLSLQSRVFINHIHFPKAKIGECDTLLGPLWIQEDFEDGIPYPNGLEVDLDDNDDDVSTNENEAENEPDSSAEDDVEYESHIHGPQIALGVAFVVFVIALVILWKKKGKTWVWDTVKEKIHNVITSATDSAVARASVQLAEMIQAYKNRLTYTGVPK